MLNNIITSIVAFASTNVDDIFILMLFYGSRKFKPFKIILGQYLGIAILVITSFIGAYIEASLIIAISGSLAYFQFIWLFVMRLN